MQQLVRRIINKIKIKIRKKILINSVRLIFLHSISLFVGQGILIGIYGLVLTPFISYLYHLALKITGYSYLTLNNIKYFLLNPLVLLLLTLLLLVLSIFLLFEACFLTSFYTQIESGGKFNIFGVVLLSFKRLFFIFWRRNFIFLILIWLIMILSNLPLFVFMAKRVRMISFITESVKKYKNLITFGLIVLFFYLLWIMAKRLISFLYALIEGKTYKGKDYNKNWNIDKNLEESKDAAENNSGDNDEDRSLLFYRRRKKKISSLGIMVYFLLWNAGIGLFDFLIYLVIIVVTAFFIAGIPDKSLAIATFLSINEKMNGYLFIGLFAINTMTNFAFYTHLFYQCKKDIQENIHMGDSVDNIVVSVGAYKTLIKIFAVILTMVIFYSFYDIVRNGSPLAYMNLDMVRVTSHRGFSSGIPENTLPAIEKAIEEQADCVEVDVRVTKDGELVLLHDESLKRTTGVNKKIWQLTLDEVSKLDAGSWKDKAYTGTQIPTLREVFELCKGKINLNLDLKYRNAEEGLEEKVVALIQEYDMQWQCVISSTNLGVLERIKELDPDIRTGYITYQIYSGYYNSDYIDFFSVRSSLVTKTICSEVHKAGKEIMVWTVNTKTELERMKRIGVDNVITDDPSYAKRILYDEESNRLLQTLVKIVTE
jgi:glycerophosphoryl diester phosphodiesterase